MKNIEMSDFPCHRYFIIFEEIDHRTSLDTVNTSIHNNHNVYKDNTHMLQHKIWDHSIRFGQI